MEAREALAGAREVFGTAKWREMGGAYNLPAREAILACRRIRPQLPAKRAGYFEKIMEGGRIDGENMG